MGDDSFMMTMQNLSEDFLTKKGQLLLIYHIHIHKEKHTHARMHIL